MTTHRLPDTVGVVVVSHTRDYLAECLDSVAAQTFAPSSVVVVDNASPATAPVAAVAADRGYRSIRVDESVSLASARNLGISLLHDCDLIASLDGDDIWMPTYVATYRAAARDRDADVVYGAAEVFGAESGVWFTAAERGARPNLRKGNFIPANSMFRRELWRSTGGFDPEQLVFEDWDFWLTCAEHRAVFAAVQEPLWRYRRHPQSMLSQAQSEAKDEARSRIRRKHLDYIRGPLQWRRGVRILEKAAQRVRAGSAS